jgi:hypothetical protein
MKAAEAATKVIEAYNLRNHQAVAMIWLRGFAVALLLLPAPANSQRLPTIPALRNGQTLIYQLDISGSRSTKVESQVTTPQSPPSEDLGAWCLLQVHVVEVSARGVRLKTYLSDRKAPLRSGEPSGGPTASPDKLVEVFLATDGTASEIKGLGELATTQQFAWNAWLNRFTSPMTFPKSGVRRGQRWKASEDETSPSPISHLSWVRNHEYVKQEACDSARPGTMAGKTAKPPGTTDTCAVIFVHAQLRQGSSPKNTTPEDYKRRGLSTTGRASGTNETILYVSTTTGLLVRSTEDVQQTMDVTVALADGSNRVHYMVNAKSRSQIQSLPDVPQDIR